MCLVGTVPDALNLFPSKNIPCKEVGDAIEPSFLRCAIQVESVDVPEYRRRLALALTT